MAQVIIWLNALANGIASLVLSPMAALPGWMSATIVASITGVLMLYVFKYTSNQSAIKRVRGSIKANLLALSLFKDSVFVSLRCQGRILGAAARLIVLALVPMIVMFIPMCLVLSQLALWYQARPLRVGEEAVVTVRLHQNAMSQIDQITIGGTERLATVAGPVRVPAERMVCWNVKALREGNSTLAVEFGEERYEKEWVVGDGFSRVSLLRPSFKWSDIVMHPSEKPFAGDSLVQSIEIVYPRRDGWATGSDYWIVFWFGMSMIAAFVAKPFLKVHI